MTVQSTWLEQLERISHRKLPGVRRLRRVLLVVILDHAFNDLLRALGGSKIDEFFDLANVGHAPLHVFEAFFIGLIIRDKTDRRVAPRHRCYHHRKFRDRDFLLAADVKNLPDRTGVTDQSGERFDRGADVTETARLFAVSVYGNGQPSAGLAHELGL